MPLLIGMVTFFGWLCQCFVALSLVDFPPYPFFSFFPVTLLFLPLHTHPSPISCGFEILLCSSVVFSVLVSRESLSLFFNSFFPPFEEFSVLLHVHRIPAFKLSRELVLLFDIDDFFFCFPSLERFCTRTYAPDFFFFSATFPF